MKDFSRSGGRLRTLPFHARLVYSVFLAFTLVALALSAWLGADMVGSDLGEVRVYYAGGVDQRPTADSTAPAGGPVLDIPDDALPSAVRDAMPLRKLLEVTHFHLFSMPVYLMILSHLFMLSSASSRSKSAWIAVASVSVALHVAAPWLARSGHASGTWFYGVSGALLTLSFLVMSGIPLWEMWSARPAALSSAPPDA